MEFFFFKALQDKGKQVSLPALNQRLLVFPQKVCLEFGS